MSKIGTTDTDFWEILKKTYCILEFGETTCLSLAQDELMLQANSVKFRKNNMEEGFKQAVRGKSERGKFTRPPNIFSLTL